MHIIIVLKTKRAAFNAALLWYLQESNQGHMDFQSIALPTELRYHCKGCKFKRIFNMKKKNSIHIMKSLFCRFDKI